MEDSRVFGDRLSTPPERQLAGVITKITLENFMCHSSLHIEFGEWVNFITGQNGSGKSAILTALCVAFGSRARGTQRASTLKDFIKTGCSHAVVNVEIKNQGEDAFKPEIYGDLIIIERKISESTSSTFLKDRQGRRVASRREELLELIEHFNIDVENPCVIMTQDKSREFLHSGNDKEKFKFYFKATLLQQVSDLLNSINNQLNDANAQVDELEASIRPIMKELNELKGKIKSMEHIEEISLQVQQLKKKLAWSWVYDVDKRIHEQANMIEKLKERIPTCQRRIERQLGKMEELKKLLIEKRTQIASMMEKTSEVRRMKDELHQNLSMATKEKLELEETHKRKVNQLQKMVRRSRQLEDQIYEIQEQHIKNTQAEECEIMEQLKGLQKEVDAAASCLTRLKDEENALSEEQSMTMNTLNQIAREIEDGERKYREISSHIRDLKQHSTNKMTAFGGEKVLSLIREIERHHTKFDMPPIGPIGAHVTLVNGGDVWALAVEHAIGRLLNAFIVTNHKDSRLLRGCAKEAKYHFVQIIIHDFSRQRLDIPRHMLPQTSHPTTLSVLHSDNPTVMNVLVDMGHAERQVLVTDYEVGKSVAFDQRIPNLKEVYTLEGCKMFSRGSVQTILPPNKKIRSGRLCGSLDDQIKNFEEEESKMQDIVRQVRGRKRNVEEILRDLKGKLQSVKKRRLDAEKDLSSKQFTYRDLESSHAAETSPSPTSNVDELRQEIMKVQNEIGEHEMLLENFQVRVKEAEIKANDLKVSFETLCDSAKDDINAFEDAEEELKMIENELSSVENEKDHYEGLMQNKVLPDIKEAEALYQELQINRQESSRKASVICPESEIEALGGCMGTTPEQLSAQLNRLNQRLQQESQRYSGSLDDLRVLYEKKERKILRKQQTYAAFREKLNSCTNALQLRMEKHAASRNFTRKTLSLKFNALLGKKGISGSIKVDYEEKTLSLEVKMPQDSSSNTVRDTKALSGGERSFSTLCFALALHGMTEAPFRAMDEFDVFMDAISRKISLDTLVDFALDQGSQWIFITPHDISMVKPGDRVKKQQMAAPRS